MRRILSTIASLGLLASSAAPLSSAWAQARCSSPDDQAAFDVGAMKSELSILAVGCHDEDQYNAFVEKFRSVLVSEDAVVNAWFKKRFGRSATSEYDSYITLLANEQSSIGQHQGTDWCPRLKADFDEVMAVPRPELLADYASVKDVVPAAVGSCGNYGQAVSSPSRASPARRVTTRTHHASASK